MSQKNINKKTRSKKRNIGMMGHPRWVRQLHQPELWDKLQRSVPKRAYRTARRAFELGAFTTCKGVFERYGLWPAEKKQKSKSRV